MLSETHVERDDVKAWISHPVTLVVCAAIVKYFDHQAHLLGADENAPSARFKGRAEVLQFLHDPQRILALIQRQES